MDRLALFRRDSQLFFFTHNILNFLHIIALVRERYKLERHLLGWDDIIVTNSTTIQFY